MEAVVERVAIRIADPADDVPVRPARRQRQRRPGSERDQPPVGIQRFEEGQEIELVGPAAVEKDERAVRRSRGRAELMRP